MVERSQLVAMRASRAEARRSQDRGICSRSPVVERRPVAYGKSNPPEGGRFQSSVFGFQCVAVDHRPTRSFGDFCRPFLPERISQTAARRTVSGIQQRRSKSGAVISGDMILKWIRIWSQVAAGLRNPFRQNGPTSTHLLTARLIVSFRRAERRQSPDSTP